MKCKKGDYARVINSVHSENIGKIVLVKEYIGKLNRGDVFNFRGILCMTIVNDHYWWIQGEDLTIGIGISPQAYIPDSWLEPIHPPTVSQECEEIVDIAA